MPLRIPATVTGLEASIQSQAKKAGRSLKINMGAGGKSIEGLSQPLGRITGKADQFTKSMEAANARVLAFGASVGILSAVTQGFKELVNTTIEVEKRLTSINAILGTSAAQLDKFKKTIFEVARNTEQSFDTVSQAALELSRQGLKAEEVTKRLNDAMILSRLSGQGAAEAVAGLTAAINSFKKSGVTSTEVVNKFSDAAKSAAVSERDLAEAIKRAGSVANIAGVSLDELVGIVSAVQQKTSRGGAVIGNSFKTIFTRIQSLDKLKTMQNLGVQIEDTSGNILNATQLIKNLAAAIGDLPEARQLQIAENLVGKFQVAPFVAILEDYNDQASIAIRLTEVSQKAATGAYDRNTALNVTLSAAINQATVNMKELADTLGKLGVTDNLKGILSFFNSLVGSIKDLMEGEGIGSDFARGLIKGIGNVISGPGLAVVLAVIAKLTYDLTRFGLGSLQTFFGLNKAAKEQAALQGQIASTLLGSKSIQEQILAIENSTLSTEQKRIAQAKFFTVALNEQMRIMTQMQVIASRITPAVARGTRGGGGRAAGGFIPNFDATRGYGSERADIARGVGGAPPSARAVAIPNFNFGGGQRGTMTANTSEFVVPNFAGRSGSAIFNQNMAASMGLPANAKQVGAAGGFIPNFRSAGRNFVAPKSARGMVNSAQDLVLFVGDRGKDEPFNTYTVGKLKGKTTAYVRSEGVPTDLGNKAQVRVPTYRLKPRGQNKTPDDIEKIKTKISDGASSAALKFARNLAHPSKLPTITQDRIKGLFNKGSFEGFAGSTFEASIASILESRQFADYAARTATSRIDLPYSPRLFSRFGAKGVGKRGAEVKATGRTDLKKSAAVKFYDILAPTRLTGEKQQPAAAYKGRKTGFVNREVLPREAAARWNLTGGQYQAVKKFSGNNTFTRGGYNQWLLSRGRPGILRSGFAEGYIPNFANPLQDAIGRERASGLPLNQIRVNQDNRLRGSGNPMGLAVTNMRDEPTGRIPNFAGASIGRSYPAPVRPSGPGAARFSDSSSASKSLSQASGDLLIKFIVLQSVVQLLSGFMSDQARENVLLTKTMSLLNIAMIAFMAKTTLGLSGGGLANFARGRTGAGIMGAGRRRMGIQGATGAGAFGRAGMRAAPLGARIAGGAVVAGGAAAAAAGPIVAVAVAAVALREGFDVLSGNAQHAADSQKDVAEASKKAAEQLAKLRVPQEFKEQQAASAGRVGRGLTAEILDSRSAKTLGLPKTVASMGGILPGKDFKQMETLASAFAGAQGGGLREQTQRAFEIQQEIIDESNRVSKKTFGFSGRISRDFFDEKLDELRGLATTDAGSVATRLQESIGDRQIRELGQFRAFQTQAETIGVKDKPIAEQISAVGKVDPLLTKGLNLQIEKQIQEIFGTRFTDITAKGLTKGLGEAAGRSFKEREEAVSRVRGDTSKIELDAALKLVQLKAKRITQSERELRSAEQLGGASKAHLQSIKEKIALEKTTLQTSSNSLKIIQEQVKSISSLNVDDSKKNALMKIFRNMTIEDVNDTEKRKNIVEQINLLDHEAQGLGTVILANIEAQYKREQDLGEEKLRQVKTSGDLNVLEAKRVDLLERIRSIQQLNIGSRSLQAGSGLSRRQTESEDRIARIQADPTRTDRERRAALFRESRETDRVSRERFTLESATQLSKQFSQLGSNFGVINSGMDKLIQNFNPSNIQKTAGGFSRVLANAGLSIKNQIAALDPERNSETIQHLKNLGLKINETIGSFITLDEQLKISAKLRKEMVRPQVKPAGTMLGNFVDGLEQAGEQIKFDSIFGGPMQGFGRQFRENRARQSAGRDMASQRDISREFALQGLQDAASTGVTRAERRQGEREIPFVEKQFRLQGELNRLQNEATPNLEKIREVELEILKIERERKSVNQSIGAIFEDTFIKSDDDIKRELGSNLRDAALNFKNIMTDAMVDSIARGENLGDALRSAASDFFRMISKGFMQSAVDKFIKGASGGGGFFGTIFSSLTEEKNGGGLITGGSGSRDDVPTLLTSGEFVIRRSAVERYGPEFLGALNRGGIQTMQRGGLYTPGTHGQGAITGQRDLLDFTTQSHTGGQFDRVGGGEGFGSVALEPMSARLTMFGRRHSPYFQREQDSQREALGLFIRQSQYEEQLREEEAAQGRALTNAMLSAVMGVGINAIADGFAAQRGSVSTDSTLGLADPSAGIMLGGGDLSYASRGGAATGASSPRGGAPSVGLPRRGASRRLSRNRLDIARGGSGGLNWTGEDFWGNDDSDVLGNVGGTGWSNRITGRADYIPNMTPRGVVPTNAMFGWTDSQFNDWFNLPLAERVIQLRRDGDFTGASHAYRFGKAGGGPIPYAAGIDTVPINASGGEFMMNAAATENIGVGTLTSMNSGGGVEDGSDAIVDAVNNLSNELAGAGESVINITINSEGTETQDAQGNDEGQQNLASRLRDAVRATLEEEKRLGGVLRR